MNISADIGLSFHIEPTLAPRLYGRFRLNDLAILSDGYMRNTVREAFNDVASKLPVQDIYGAGKSKMLGDVAQKCRDVFGKDGIVIDQLTINGALRLPQNVMDAINRAMEATQNAIQSRNRVAQVEAEATQAITQAHGQAEAARQKAQGDARRAPHPRPLRGAGERDHPALDDAGGPAVPRDRALGRQAPAVQRGRAAPADVRPQQAGSRGDDAGAPEAAREAPPRRPARPRRPPEAAAALTRPITRRRARLRDRSPPRPLRQRPRRNNVRAPSFDAVREAR